MQIHFAREGGFAAIPGLSRPVPIDTRHLPADEAAELEGLVNSAQFFERPTPARPAPPGAADYRQYTITVEDGARRHTVRIAEPIADPVLQALVTRLQSLATRSRSGGDSGAR